MSKGSKARFWISWLSVAVLGAWLWLKQACLPGACSGILIFLEAPLVIGLLIFWLILGAVIHLVWSAATKQSSRKER